MGIVDALDDRCLAASARLVAWSTDRGWHDRNALMRDLSAGRAVSALLWTIPMVPHWNPWTSPMSMAAPLFLSAMSALESRDHARRIGSGDTLEGWRSETMRAASRRSVARTFRLFVLFVAVGMVASSALLAPVGFLSAPSVLVGIVCVVSLPAYFVLLAARAYVEAADPPPPRTRTETVPTAKAAMAAG